MSQVNAAQDLKTCEKTCEDLRSKIKEIRSVSGDTVLKELSDCQNVDIRPYKPSVRNECLGHFGKVYALHWGPDSKYIVTASQDGKLIVWNSFTGNKQLAITLNSAWVMTCAFSPTYDYIASGGLDNTVTIYRTIARDQANQGPNAGLFKCKDTFRELEKHDGYLSCARFLNNNKEIISASGDGTCILWDIESKRPINSFIDHSGDVMSIALNEAKKNIFVSGSVDATAKVWDIRSDGKAVANFPGHTADINCVQWFPDNEAILAGGDDSSVRMFDMRSYKQLNMYRDKNNTSQHSPDPAGVTSLDTSKSGCFIFVAYDNGQLYNWNSLNCSLLADMKQQNRVSSLGVSPDGYALATACWDFRMTIWA